MPNRILLELSERPSIRRFITKRRFTRAVVDRFVAGDLLEDALGTAKELEVSGITSILDYLGEHCTSPAQADAILRAYTSHLRRVASEKTGGHISVKLTQLGLDLSFEESLRRMEFLCEAAESEGITVAIDMESHQYTESTIEIYRRLRSRHTKLVLCLQAYLQRTPDDVESLLALDPAIRLCKGAYNEPREITIPRRKIRARFRELMMRLIECTSYTAIATHDEWLITEARRYAKRKNIPKDRFEFQMLYGVRRDLQQQLAQQGYGVRVYIPFGDEWYPYLTRRLAERPANLRFFLEALMRG